MENPSVNDLNGLRQAFDPEVIARGFADWKASLWLASKTPDDRWANARRFVGAGHPCTGVSAAWCPNCGDCICDREESMDHTDCPLHAADSPHAEGNVT